MNREEAELVWFVVAYVGAIVALLVFLRTVFVPPSIPTGGQRKSPFEAWLEFSQQRAQEDIRAELEKYRIDRGLAHPTREPPP